MGFFPPSYPLLIFQFISMHTPYYPHTLWSKTNAHQLHDHDTEPLVSLAPERMILPVLVLLPSTFDSFKQRWGTEMCADTGC